MDIHPDLLDLPPEQAVRLLALIHLDAAARIRARLDDDQDGEALHDFRVALRRLRSCLRAYKPYFVDTLPAKHHRCLRKLARATYRARDAGVQIERLEKMAPVESQLKNRRPVEQVKR